MLIVAILLVGYTYRLAHSALHAVQLTVQGDYVGFKTGNGEKLSYRQAEPGLVLLYVAYFSSSVPYKRNLLCVMVKDHPKLRAFQVGSANK